MAFRLDTKRDNKGHNISGILSHFGDSDSKVWVHFWSENMAVAQVIIHKTPDCPEGYEVDKGICTTVFKL